MATIYGTVSDADNYFTERGGVAKFPSWFAADESAKQIAMLHGSDYVDLVFEDMCQGRRASETQPRAWPRSGVVVHGYEASSANVPIQVKQASWEAAYRHLQGNELLPDSIDRSSGGEIVSEEKKAGDVAKSVTYRSNTQTNLRRWRRVDFLMAPLLVGGSGSGAPVRVVW